MQTTDGAEQRAASHRVDRDALDTGAAIERRTGTHDVVVPGEAVGGAVHSHPDLAWLPESDSKHAIGEYALDAGGADALLGSDGARIGNVPAGLGR